VQVDQAAGVLLGLRAADPIVAHLDGAPVVLAGHAHPGRAGAGLAVLVGVSTFLLISLGQSSDVGVAAITVGAVMVIAALGPHDPWKQPLIGAVATAVGIAVGVAASLLANSELIDGLRRQPAARNG